MIITIGALIGLVLGLTGAGGSVLAVPLLVLLLDTPMLVATGMSLGAVFIAALLGVFLRMGQAQIQWLPAIILALFGALCAPMGRALAHALDEQLMALSFFVLVTWVSLRMWHQAKQSPSSSLTVRASVRSRDASLMGNSAQCSGQALSINNFRLPCFLRVSAAGLLTGLLSGLFGVGGGFVIVPALVTLLAMDIKLAVASSLLVIVFVSAAGFMSFVSSPIFDFNQFWPLALGGCVGMAVGVATSKYLAGPRLQRLFALALPLMSAAMLSKFF